MISEEDKTIIRETAKRFKAKTVLLFGSGADPAREAEDIDLAVEGVAPGEFFSFYGELLFDLSKPVDLIELSKDTKFNRIVRREGIVLYG